MESLAGKTLGQYRCERLLASSSLADVYQARDERLERLVAIKVSARPAALEHFRAEARLTSALDHPNILPVYDFGEQGSIAYLVRHYAAGGSLADRLRSANGKNGLPPEEVAYYLDQAAAALDYTHTKGIVHGNLKPSNLLLRERWLMLGDFAAARQAGKTSQVAPPIASNGPYSAPEQRTGAAIGPAVDMYALGVIFFQLLWGNLPRSNAAGNPTPAAISPAQPGVSAQAAQAIEELLRKAMAPRPADRPQTAGALVAEFRSSMTAPGALGGTPTEIPLICPTCGFLNKPQARFCRNDGTKLPIICPRCGAANRFDAKFCQSDGTELVRICPTCGTINPRQATFCQNDQTPLARLCPVCGFENPLRARFCERDGAALTPSGQARR